MTEHLPLFALIIQPDGTLTVKRGVPEGTYEFIRSAVEGWIEAVDLNRGLATMWVNEEGKISGMPVNPTANLVAHRNARLLAGDFIVGPVVITGGTDHEGETLPLPDHLFWEYLYQIIGNPNRLV